MHRKPVSRSEWIEGATTQLRSRIDQAARKWPVVGPGAPRETPQHQLDLTEQTRCLAVLHEASVLAADAENLEMLAQGFARQMRALAQADAVGVRWTDENNRRYVLLAADGMPKALLEHERHMATGDCGHCLQAQPHARLQVGHLQPSPSAPFCSRLGYRSVVSIPARLHHRLLGEVTLLYRRDVALSGSMRQMLEIMVQQLAGAMESMRMAALEREAAVTSERRLLARELHDSIAQSLAFLKIQAALLREAVAADDYSARDRGLDELDAGLQECLADVRALLLHFRTRTQDEDIEQALRATLSKFEHQTGLATHMEIVGYGSPLAADAQIQVLHIVHEALSNVRKHARASGVGVRVWRAPSWQFEVQDDGIGFDCQPVPTDSVHVGLEIMRERAERIGAALSIQPGAGGRGTCVTVKLPGSALQAGAGAAGPA